MVCTFPEDYIDGFVLIFGDHIYGFVLIFVITSKGLH